MGYHTGKSPLDISWNRNPDPTNFEFITYIEKNNFLLVKIKYNNCNNFEGIKILIYKNIKFIDLANRRSIDPHFSEEKPSPLARFAPTDEGWNMALRFIDQVQTTNIR